MTIKEAFQLLANATKKGMKNPFFIMRSLNNCFSEIADKIQGGGGGGSTVVVDPILAEGTKIATITVDGEDNDLYAPAGGGGGGGSWTKLGKYTGGTEFNLPETWSELLVIVAFYRGSSGTNHASTQITHDFVTNYPDLDTWIDFSCSTYEKGFGTVGINKNGLKGSLSYVQDPAGTAITNTAYVVVYYK